MERIYLDWNATAPVWPEVREAMADVLEEVPGNASSVHQEGQRARAVVEDARRALAEAVGAEPQGVVLTAGATESNNQVLRSHVRRESEPHVVCSAVEHPSVLEVVEQLDAENVETTVCPVDDEGRLSREAVEAALEEGATLVSVMRANNEVGNTYPVADIGELVHDHGATLHVDATQALGRIPVDFEEMGADVMTLSLHKMGGPKGIGALVVTEEQTVEALMAGGHQERGRRPGTENVPAAAGLEAAANLLVDRRQRWFEALESRAEIFEEALRESCGEFEHRGDPNRRLPNTFNVAFPGIDGEDFLLAADLEGVCASSGSACTAGSLEPSHVILAMGYDHDDARRSVRFSFGPSTSEEELREAAERIGRVVDRLRAV